MKNSCAADGANNKEEGGTGAWVKCGIDRIGEFGALFRGKRLGMVDVCFRRDAGPQARICEIS